MTRAYGLGMSMILIVASGAVALAQAPKKPAATTEDPAATIAVLDHVWLDAAHNRDTGTMDWLFADDFVEVHPGGFIADKKQQLDQIRDPNRTLDELHPDDIQVRYLSADVAVLTDTTTIRGTSGHVTYNGPQRVIRVFVKQHDRWRAAGAGIVPITGK